MTKKQYEVWNGLMNLESEKTFEVKIADKANEGKPIVEFLVEEPDKNQRYEILQKLSEGVLDAHIEHFGIIDEEGKKRLELVAKGIIPQYIEAQNVYVNTRMLENRTSEQIMTSVIKGQISRNEAVKKLRNIPQELRDNQNINQRDRVDELANNQNQFLYKMALKSWFTDNISDLLYNPLYQETIKEIISEKAFEEYQTHQTERQLYQQQAAQNIIFQLFDSLLLLNTTQRIQFKTITDKLTLPSMSNTGLQLMFIEVYLSIDPEMLSPWQQNVFKRMYSN